MYLRTLLSITVSRQDLTLSEKNVIEKLTVNDIRGLCERLNNFYNVWPGELSCIWAWERALTPPVNLALQSILQVTITEQAVRDSAFVQ